MPFITLKCPPERNGVTLGSTPATLSEAPVILSEAKDLFTRSFTSFRMNFYQLLLRPLPSCNSRKRSLNVLRALTASLPFAVLWLMPHHHEHLSRFILRLPKFRGF
jgi:hypothetical protein